VSLRLAALALLGASLGFALSLASSACTCPDDPLNALPAGAYVPTPEEAHSDAAYRLELAADRSAVTETFTRDGKDYVINYDVKPATP
jgi:hypothetical protein